MPRSDAHDDPKDLDLVTETNAQEAPAPFGEGAGDPCVRAATFCRPATDERLASHYLYISLSTGTGTGPVCERVTAIPVPVHTAESGP